MKVGNRIMVAAPSSGSGKTTLTCALLSALVERGMRVHAFKTGPDYIDPLFHQKVIGIPSENLDAYFLKEEELKNLLLTSCGEEPEEAICVVEGAMGLLDGLGGRTSEASAMDVACKLQLPIVLVVDARGMGRSILALLAGFLQYDRDSRIRGVILNRVGKSLFRLLAPMIEEELGLEVVGYFPDCEDIRLESRHLGLKLPGEISDIQDKIRGWARVLEESVDVNKILRIARSAGPLELGQSGAAVGKEPDGMGRAPAKEKFYLGIARDEAFCFYYEDNKRILEALGAVLVPFSPLRDRALPEGISGLWLGGGYPELYTRELSANCTMRESIRRAITEGMPSVAECGGFMYLHESMTGEDGLTYPMVGLVAGSCANGGRLTRFGYVELTEKEPLFLERQEGIRGHEFHYYDSDNNGRACLAVKPVTGRSWECVHVSDKSWWGYPHLYYRSNPSYPESFARMCRTYQGRKRDVGGGI